MHSKNECNYLLATHEAAVAVARTHYCNNVGCGYCSCDCHYCGCNCSYNIIKQLRLLRLLQLRLLAHQPYVATPSTPSWHMSAVSMLMVCTKLLELGAMYVTATCNVYRGCHCTSQSTKWMQTLLWHKNCNSHNKGSMHLDSNITTCRALHS